jgi:oxygen-independent coproporphyrinogen-3 oxidase
VHLYVHVPFCARRCSYCDFAIAVRRAVPTDAYVDAVAREWHTWQAHPAWIDSPTIDTVYFGGGTPSRLDPSGIARLLDRIGSDRSIAPSAEITLEANPDDVTPAAAAAWVRAGVNRVSLGTQSFDPAALAWMHRTHTAEQVPRAVAVLRAAGIANLSLDLIFALPPALGRDWRRDLDAALALAPEHLSLYGLTVEPQTPLGRWTVRGDAVPAADDAYAAEFLDFAGRLRAEGWDHYEVSNAARPGFRSRHNSAYWARAPFIGIGPSAHSGFGNRRRWNIREWEAYRVASAADLSVVAGEEELGSEELALEEVYLGLRTREGLAAGRLEPAVVTRWETEGWAETAGGRLRLTPEGWLRLDALAVFS